MSDNDLKRLGRGVIVDAGDPVPAAWAKAERVVVGEGAATNGSNEALDAVEALATAWMAREPVVVELGVDPAIFRVGEETNEPPWSIDPGLMLTSDRLHFLIWANNYDARGGDLTWWWGRKAENIGGGSTGDEDAAGDVLVDGSPAWVDGGPRWSIPDVGLPVIHAESVESGFLRTLPQDLSSPDADLAPDQLKAVGHDGGPLRVIAPAGSGKTRVLTERLRHLLGDRGYDRGAVLGVAYNKEAQQELESRLVELRPRTQTLNSLGYGLLGEHRDGRPRMIDEMQVRDIASSIFPIPRQRRANTDPIGPYLDALTQVRLGLIAPRVVEEMRDDVPGLEEGFERYRNALTRAGGIDFDEQIYGALKALLRDGAFRRKVQLRHRHLLVDEFQDLTPAHLLMVRLLAMPMLDVFGVGDDDQTIYDHAGADPRFLVDFADYFPGAEATALEVNYRCPEATVNAAARLLTYNRVRVDKEIHAGPNAVSGEGAMRVQTHGSSAGAEALVEVVGGWLGEPDVVPGDIAVLARVNSLLLAPQIALVASGAPVTSALSANVLDRTGIAAALAWLRVAVDPEGLIPSDLETVGRRPSRGFPRWIGKWFANCRTVADLKQISERIDDDRVAGRVEELAIDIEMVAAVADGGTTRQVLEMIRDRIGLGSAMDMLDDSKGSQSAGGHLDDLEGLLQVSDLMPDPGEFEPWLRASLAEPGRPDGVRLATVHKVKGREWPRVAVFGVTDGIVPHRLAADAEAERRVLHVAITRGIEQTVVLGDAERRSPFLDELTGEAKPAADREVVTTARERGESAAPKRAGSRNGAGVRRAPAAIELDAGAEAVAEALRTWRSQRASEDSVPAYVVLSNRHIDAIAAASPGSETELLKCEGIGPTRLDRYGDEILAVVAGAAA